MPGDGVEAASAAVVVTVEQRDGAEGLPWVRLQLGAEMLDPLTALELAAMVQASALAALMSGGQ